MLLRQDFLTVQVKTMQRHLCLLQMARSAGLHDILSVEDKHTLITELIQHYQSGLKFGKGILGFHWLALCYLLM